MNRAQTDNTFFWDKVKLRLNSLPQKSCIKVLDCYAGNSRIWKQIMKHRNIVYVPIEKKSVNGVYLKGDNLRFLRSLDLSSFDVIDLDSYGVPYRQLKEVFLRAKKCIVFVTFNQTIFGGLPLGLLEEIGYSRKMVKKCPTPFWKNGLEKFEQFLSHNGISKIKIRPAQRKNYIAFSL